MQYGLKREQVLGMILVPNEEFGMIFTFSVIMPPSSVYSELLSKDLRSYNGGLDVKTDNL